MCAYIYIYIYIYVLMTQPCTVSTRWKIPVLGGNRSLERGIVAFVVITSWPAARKRVEKPLESCGARRPAIHFYPTSLITSLDARPTVSNLLTHTEVSLGSNWLLPPPPRGCHRRGRDPSLARTRGPLGAFARSPSKGGREAFLLGDHLPSARQNAQEGADPCVPSLRPGPFHS